MTSKTPDRATAAAVISTTEIREKMAAGDLDAALAGARSEVARLPRNPNRRALLGRVLEEQGLVDEAKAEYRQALGMRPDHIAASLRLMKLLVDAGDKAAAEALLDEGRRAGLAGDTCAQLECDLAKGFGDLPRMAGALRLLAGSAGPRRLTYLVQLFRVHLRLKDFDKAAETLDLIDKKATPTALVDLEVELAAARGFAPGDLEWLYEMRETHPDSIPCLKALLQCLRENGHVEEEQRELAAALKRHPQNASLMALAVQRGIVVSGAALEAVPDSKWPVFRRAIEVAGLGRLDQARAMVAEALEHVRPGEAKAGPLRDVAAFLADLPADALLKRPVIADDLSRDVVRAEVPGADTIVIVFTGFADRVGFPPVLFDRYLASLGLPVMVLRDWHRMFYLRGVKSIGDRQRTLEQVRTWVAGRRVCMIGNSAGGYAAADYGLELGADRIVLLAGPTDLSAEFRARIDDRRAGTMFRRAEEALGKEAVAAQDLRRRLDGGGHAARIHLFYGADMREDAAHAAHLSGLLGVAHHPVPECDRHDVLVKLIEAGGWRERLADVLGVPVP